MSSAVFLRGCRVMEVLGVENAASLFGDFRDWATCWPAAEEVPGSSVLASLDA